MTIELHHGDLPDGLNLGSSVAVDTEAMGLNNMRDRLCLVQLSAGDGKAHIVKFEKDEYNAPNLKRLISDPKVLKIFHYARFDVAIMKAYLQVECKPIYCTRTASKLCRTYTNSHSLKALCEELLDITLEKQQQSSYWGAEALSDAQLAYAASDVLHLHELKEKLDEMLSREGRTELAQKCFDFIGVRAQLDLEGWVDADIFAH